MTTAMKMPKRATNTREGAPEPSGAVYSCPSYGPVRVVGESNPHDPVQLVRVRSETTGEESVWWLDELTTTFQKCG